MPAPGSPAGDADPDRADFFADSGGVARFKITPDGALLKERPSGGGWVHTAPRVDFERIDATTDAEIERQEIADLVEDALEREASRLWLLACR
jgi:hypothetical protein